MAEELHPALLIARGGSCGEVAGAAHVQDGLRCRLAALQERSACPLHPCLLAMPCRRPQQGIGHAATLASEGHEACRPVSNKSNDDSCCAAPLCPPGQSLHCAAAGGTDTAGKGGRDTQGLSKHPVCTLCMSVGAVYRGGERGGCSPAAAACRCEREKVQVRGRSVGQWEQQP